MTAEFKNTESLIKGIEAVLAEADPQEATYACAIMYYRALIAFSLKNKLLTDDPEGNQDKLEELMVKCWEAYVNQYDIPVQSDFDDKVEAFIMQRRAAAN